MRNKVFLIFTIIYVIIFISGYAKNKVEKPNYNIKPFDSNINAGIISFVGNSFEYYNIKQTFNNVFRYTEIND